MKEVTTKMHKGINNEHMNDNKGKKDWPARTFRIPPELLDRLNRYCSETGISKTFVIEKALTRYLDETEVIGK